MTVEVEGELVRLSGRCGAEEAEALLSALVSGVPVVDLSGCEHLHASLVQLLMAARPAIVGEPASFLARWVIPLVDQGHDPGADRNDR